MKQNTLVSIVYLIIALMMAGLPPFSGFFGKVFILQASGQSEHQMLIIFTVLLVSLLSILALPGRFYSVLAFKPTGTG